MRIPFIVEKITHAPHRDVHVSVRGTWAAILVVLAAANLVLISWSAYLFIGISRESLFLSENNKISEIVPTGQEEIRARAALFRERDTLLERYKKTPLTIPDPSL